jgi:hypothetical protein
MPGSLLNLSACCRTPFSQRVGPYICIQDETPLPELSQQDVESLLQEVIKQSREESRKVWHQDLDRCTLF